MKLEEIGDIIRQRRKALGITQQELADLGDVNINTIVSLERAEGNPKVLTLINICEVLGFELKIGMQ